MVRKKKREKDDNLAGFLMGLLAGTIVYGFLSLFEKPECPICKTPIQKNTAECPYCHSRLRWR